MKLHLCLLCAVLLSLPGCIFVRHDRHGHHRDDRDGPRCRPSEYWDGYQCRHKGKGKGPHKHDH